MLMTCQQFTKSRYPRVVAFTTLLALTLITLTFLYSPIFRADPYALPTEQIVKLIPPPEIIPEPLPKDIPMPESVPNIIPVDGPGSAEEIAPSNPDFLPDIPPQAIARSSGPGPFKVVDQLPELYYHATVNYPEFAIDAELEGQVLVQVGLDERGRVISASIFSSNTHSILETAALDAAWRCKFKPGRQRSIPVRTIAVIPFIFRIRN